MATTTVMWAHASDTPELARIRHPSTQGCLYSICDGVIGIGLVSDNFRGATPLPLTCAVLRVAARFVACKQSVCARALSLHISTRSAANEVIHAPCLGRRTVCMVWTKAHTRGVECMCSLRLVGRPWQGQLGGSIARAWLSEGLDEGCLQTTRPIYAAGAGLQP